jgi:TRAP-type uncharacterized transport system fused permease subunit
MAAHLFIFFFGVLGNITPPSAPCSFAAAGIARTDPLKTTNLAFLISAPTYIIPYMVVYSPELMLKGSLLAIIFRITTTFLAVSGTSMVFLGFFLRDLRWIPRAFLLVASILLISHNWTINVVGYVMMGMVFVWQKVYGQPATSISKIE